MRRWRPQFVLPILLTLSVAGPAAAAPSRAGDDTPNFNESGGCGAWSMRPPLADQSGFLGSDHQTHGPWADFFGRSYDQVRASMVWWTVPMSGGKQVLVHARALAAFQQVSDNLAAEAALGRWYPVNVAYGFTWRTVSGSLAMSHHAFGNAVDINPAQNPLTLGDRLVTDMPQWFVDAWTQAGFCWGGYWKSIKDPMHFSWEGPPATPGFGARPTAYAPLTSADTFRERGVVAQTPFSNAAGWTVAVADRSGDGADDLYGVRPNGAATRVEVAGSMSDFRVIGMREDAPVLGTALLMGDYLQTGRADLWVLDLTTPTVEISIYSDASDFQARTAHLVTPVVMQAGTEFALADYDRDWRLDLFVIRRDGGGSTSVTVLDGATGFSTTLLHALTNLGLTTDPAWQFALGDYDLDAVPDLYAVHTSVGTVAVVRGGEGFAGVPIQMATNLPPGRSIAIGDHDGDGRDDLYAFEAASGALDVLLGGRPPGGAPLTTWFQAPGLAPWDAGPECLGPHPCHQIGFVDPGSRFFLKHDLSSDGGEDAFYYGNPGDVPLMGDWDCDGVDTPAMYRPSNGFVYLRNSNTQGVADQDF
ncbi:MAG: M15 family metallopeptidase, partial [Acidimicrobiia bacterium]